jgi:signal transduction histidine kinase
MTTFFDEIKAYVGFGEADTAALRSFLPYAESHFQRIVDHFYECILDDEGARAILADEAQVQRLKRTMVLWLESGLSGPHDEPFYERRARIGRVHVRIALPQRYMLLAMNVMRRDLRTIVEQAFDGDAGARQRVGDALDKLLDLELAIMLRTYQEDSEDRLRRNTRLAAVGQLAASIAHELRNPLGVMESSLYLLRRKVAADAQVTRHLDRIAGQIRASTGIITDLLEMTRDRPPNRVPTPLEGLLDEAQEVVRLPPTVTVTRDLEPGLSLLVEGSLVVRALANLLHNAVNALEGGQGTIRIAAQRAGADVQISVTDTGPGFPESVLMHAFEPLVTSRPHGVGLGLALVRRICERHGGSVQAGNAPGGGAVVTLRLPAAQTTEASA